jgi:hypothetical protein
MADSRSLVGQTVPSPTTATGKAGWWWHACSLTYQPAGPHWVTISYGQGPFEANPAVHNFSDHVVGDAHREAVEKVASVVDAIGRQTLTVN